MINTGSDGGRGSIQRMQPPDRITGPTRRSTKGLWTADEDETLRKAVQLFQGKNWKKIAECMKDRTDVQCLHRWQKVLNPDLVKGPWSKEEDELINTLVKKYGAKKWSTIARHMTGRIGKQCRERWHNHLNPNIKKDAWTQEEELILIQAHQTYGNKWAELMKFLPGRTDNAIKNHWNSALKKKLDSYVASDLFPEFQGLPQVTDTGQSLPSSSSTAQWSCGDSVPKDGVTKAEEISECSQKITIDFNKRFEEVATLPVQELPSEMGGLSNILGHSYSDKGNNSAIQDGKINLNELSNVSSLDLGLNFYMHSVGVVENNGLTSFPQQVSIDKPENMISEKDCFRDVCPDLDKGEGDLFTRNSGNCSDVADFSGPSAPLLQRALHYQIHHFNGAPHFSNDPNQFNDVLQRSQQDELAKSPSNGFCRKNDCVETILECGKCNIRSPQDEQGPYSLQLVPGESFSSDLAKDSPKLVPVDVLSSIPSSSNNETTSPMNESLTVIAKENDRGSLCYNPPRFPSVDIPFFSCDLLHASDDVHQEYSPLGIRRLMTSSVNCLSPLRLWDSPPRDDSPCAVLKSSAKTFTRSPPLSKKRTRDLTSPILEKRDEKRPEINMNQELFSDLSRDFSQLDVMYFENENQTVPVPSFSSHGKEIVNHAHGQENQSYSPEGEKEEDKDINADNTVTVDNANENSFQDQGLQPLGILVEHNMNGMYFVSPDPFGVKSENINLGNQHSKSLGCTSSVSVVNSPVVSKNKDRGQLHHPEAMDGSSGNDSGVENFIFGDTPLERSFKSLSSWKSRFFNSFIPEPRVNTNITVEDIGYLLSSGDRSVDAIELMMQLSEQSSEAFADAQKVLGDETPETILKRIRSKEA